MAFNEALAERIRLALARRKNVEAKKTFGGVGFLLNGNLLVGVWKDSLIVRLGPDEGDLALLEPHVREFDIAEFQKVVPVLKVSDMQRSVAFYTGVLGFTGVWRAANDGGGENCMLQAGAADLLLSTGSHLGDKPQFTGTLSFHMSGVQEFFERIKNQVEVVWPLEAMDYGQQEFGIHDCDGYTLAFAEPLEADAGGRQ